MNLIAHSFPLLAFCFDHDAGIEVVVVPWWWGTGRCTISVLVLVLYNTCTHELLSLVGTEMDLNMSGVVTYQYNCGRAIIDTRVSVEIHMNAWRQENG